MPEKFRFIFDLLIEQPEPDDVCQVVESIDVVLHLSRPPEISYREITDDCIEIRADKVEIGQAGLTQKTKDLFSIFRNRIRIIHRLTLNYMYKCTGISFLPIPIELPIARN